MFKDLKQTSDNTLIESDICIIGTGAAGLSIALEFINTRFKVVVMESGGFKFEQDTQEIGNVVGVGEPLRETHTWLRMFGGTLNAWAGGWQVINEIDFEKKSSVLYSGWPIPHSEVGKYWSIVATRYRLPPIKLHDTRHWLPKINNTTEHKLIDQNTRIDIIHRKPLNLADYHRALSRSENIEIYLHANVTHLNLSTYYNKIDQVKAQSICGNSMTCKAKYIILAAGAFGNPGLLLNSRDKMNMGIGNQNNLVGKFYMNHPKGHLGDIVPFNKKIDLPHFFGTSTPYGGMFMVLSPSTSIMRKNGLLNHHVRFSPVYQYKTLPRYEHENLPGYRSLRALKYKYIKSSRLSELGITPNIARGRTWNHVKNVWLDLPKLAHVSVKKICNAPIILKSIAVKFRLEQVPNPESRVYLSNEQNCFGQNKLAVDWKIDSAEKESLKKFHGLLKRSLKNIGHLNGSLEETDQWPISADASHHLGTTRMALTDKEGAVDKDCKVFGIENLFIAGGSVFPTGGGSACPTFTIIALSIRLADHLKRRLS